MREVTVEITPTTTDVTVNVVQDAADVTVEVNQGIQGPTGPKGADGTEGADGATGATGAGVPTGGTTGQVLAKIDASDYSTEWVTGGGGASELSDLTDVNTSTPTDGNVLVADGVDWESRALTLGDLTGTMAEFDAACADGDFAYLAENNSFTNTQNITPPNVLGEYTAMQIINNSASVAKFMVEDDAFIIKVTDSNTPSSVTDFRFDRNDNTFKSDTFAHLGTVGEEWNTLHLIGLANALGFKTVEDDADYFLKSDGSVDTTTKGEIDLNTAKDGNATHTGDVTGATVLTITAGAVDIPMFSATGTADATTFLRGDNTWAVPAGGGGASELSDLSDVSTSTPTNRFVLVADGIDFESRLLVEADISDLGTYLTTETNDLTTAVVWDDVPDVNITESSVTQHEAAIDHDALLNFAANEHFTEASIDHTNILNIGTNTHAQIDTHIADATLHFTEASISITESQISDLGSYSVTGHTHVAANITDFDTEVSNNSSVVANTAKVTFPGFTSLLTDYSFTDNSTDWDTAFGWGDHSGTYSLLGHTHTASEITDFDTEVGNNSAVTLNTAKVTYDDAAAVALNTAKVTYDDAAAVALNTAKVTNATHTGDVTGSTALTIAAGAVDIAMMSASGTASATTFLRGDNTWATPAGGGSAPTLSKAITIPNPVATDDATIFFTPVAITVTDIRSHITGTTNVVFNIGHASTRTGTQLDVFTSDITLTSTAGQSNNSGFNDETIPANSWVWLEVVSVSGTPTMFHTTIIYTED